MEISLCMIVKNEEKNLGRCLESVHDLVEELIIVDTGSTDRTVEIARAFTDKIFFFEWINDFSAARNYCFSKGTKEYLMVLDADDVLTEPNREKLMKLKKLDTNKYDVILMNFQSLKNGILGSTLVRMCIIKRELQLKWDGAIHEAIDYSCVPEERRYISDIIISHIGGDEVSSDRNFNMLQERYIKGDRGLRTLYYYAQELYAHGYFDRAIDVYERFFELNGAETSYGLYSCMHLHNLYIQKQESEKALSISLKCADSCCKRSEFCCQLGDYYKDIAGDIEKAIEWYTRATQCPIITDSHQNTIERFYYYVPNYNLGQIFLKQGRLEEAKTYLQRALEDLKRRQIEPIKKEQ